ncbi:MAG: SDR family oxidoreductase [Pyrinomonadaceae bacterium]|nr:SDR family oxidoreductase [Pyrinomonadaceae bacterium]
MKINNKIVIITGGSRGLGKNSALSLAQNGADVILTYRSRKEEADKVVAEISQLGQKATALPLDTGKTETFDEFLAQIKEILQTNWQRENFDFLINNAGIDSAAMFPQTTEEAFDNLFNVHFKGVYFLTQKALPFLADGGGIINFSTGLARFSTPGYSAYASMKGAIEVFTRYLAKELGSRRIRANVIAPGAIETDFTKEAFEHAGIKEFIASQTALGRVGLPDDIGGIVAFLCSEEARWINAQRIEVSGGMFL